MILPKILVIDDEIASSNYDVTRFVSQYNLIRLGDSSSRRRDTVAEAEFCTGQTPEGENNYEAVIKPAVEKGWGNGKRWNWALVLLDVTFGKGNKRDDKFGEKVRELLARDFPGLPVVMLTAKLKHELDSRQSTAYLSKLNEGGHQFKVSLARHGRLTEEQWRWLLELPGDFIAVSRAMKEVLLEAFQIAPEDAFVSLLGETGVGKTIVARYIHRLSPRGRNHDMAEPNTAGLEAADQTIINIKLFGRRANYPNVGDPSQPGIFEEANGSTLFLDEIGEISQQAQASILKVLEDRSVRREGTTIDIPLDFRLITATLKDPEKLIADGVFREDFYQRIQSVEINIPPLRERPEDILPMAHSFVEAAARKANRSSITLSDGASEFLRRYEFPRNVRQLHRAIESIVARKGSGETITEEDVARALKRQNPSSQTPPLSETSVKFEPEQVVSTEASALTLSNLHERIAKLLVSPHDPYLKGAIPRLEQAFEELKKKLAGAALIASKGTKQEPNLASAWRHLEGKDVPNNGDGTEAKRFFNELLGRGRKGTPLSEADINLLIAACDRKTGSQ